MITVDWGDPDEKLIVIRVDGVWKLSGLNIAIARVRSMLSKTLFPVDLLVDTRRADQFPSQVVRRIDYEMKRKSPKLRIIVAIATPAQIATVGLISNFFPEITSNIIVVDNVEHAYQLIMAVA